MVGAGSVGLGRVAERWEWLGTGAVRQSAQHATALVNSNRTLPSPAMLRAPCEMRRFVSLLETLTCIPPSTSTDHALPSRTCAATAPTRSYTPPSHPQ